MSSSSSSGSGGQWVYWVTTRQNRTAVRTEATQLEFEVLNLNGNPVDMVGKSILLSAYAPFVGTPYLNIVNARWDVAGPFNNLLRATMTAGETNVSMSLQYTLWNQTDNQALYTGYLNIVDASKNGN